MVAILQLPSMKIFPTKDNRYEGAPQEMIYNIKSKIIIIILNNIILIFIFNLNNRNSLSLIRNSIL